MQSMTQEGKALFGLASHLCGHNRYPCLRPLSAANLEKPSQAPPRRKDSQGRRHSAKLSQALH